MRKIFLVVTMLLSTGCTTYTSDLNITSPYYTDRSLTQERRLELPPDLSLEVTNSLKNPDLNELSSIDQLRSRYGNLGSEQSLQLQVARAGTDEWVEIKAPVKDLWPRIITFWSGENIKITKENIGSGTMITQWTKNLNRHYPQSENMDDSTVIDWFEDRHQDRYLLQISPSKKKGTYELRFYHESRMLAEVDDVGKRWLPIPKNEFYRKEMLARLLQYLSHTTLSSDIRQALRVTGLDGPFQFVQNEYAESYLVIPDTPYRVVEYFKNALAKLGYSGELSVSDRYATLTMRPCITVVNNNDTEFRGCSLRVGYTLHNSIIVIEDDDDKSLDVSASRNFFKMLAEVIIAQSLAQSKEEK